MEENNAGSSEQRSLNDSLPEYIAVEEAARILGVTARAVYWYLERGKLACTRGGIYLLRREDVTTFKRTAPGRVRTSTPCWRMPPAHNALSLTAITGRIRPGQRLSFTEKLAAMHQEGTHMFPGTAARSIASNPHDPDEITILLVWRQANQPVSIPCQEALAALMADFAEVLDWNTAHVQNSQGLLHA